VTDLIDLEGDSPSNLAQALERLSADELVAFPTETVWGLGARAFSHAALERLRSFKGRAADQPVSVLIDQPEALASFGVEQTPLLTAIVEAFWPGPLTLVVSCSRDSDFAPGVANAAGAIGFRCSDHPVTAQLVREASARGLGPVTATSFNLSGQTPVGTQAEAELLAKSHAQILTVLDAATCEAGGSEPSTVLDLTDAKPRVLRFGAVTLEELEPVLEGFHGLAPRR
jgi:L-threonylcarbamoyladenylate synthase